MGTPAATASAPPEALSFPHLPGFRVVNTVPIDRFLRARPGLRMLCISDTHLYPHDRAHVRDAPEDLLSVIQAFPEHRVVLLGDVTESLPIKDDEVDAFATSPRLRPLFSELVRRGAVVVPGNHDQRALAVLKRCMGQRQVLIGGFRLDQVVFVHGHELGADESHWVNDVTPWAVFLGAMLDRLGLPFRFGAAANREIAAHYEARGAFPIFGHTHVAHLGPTYANTGCFLREKQAFVTLEDGRLSLWKGLWQ